jgi:hypothetical protein
VPGPQGIHGPKGTAAPGHLMVLLDANGKFVATSNAGYYLKVNGVQVGTLTFTHDGFAQADITQMFMLHTSTDCSGPRYWSNFTLSVSAWVPDFMVFNNIGYYSNPTLQINAFSVEQFEVGDDPSKPASRCLVFLQGLGGPSLAGPLLTIDVNTLGLTPPFTLHFQ